MENLTYAGFSLERSSELRLKHHEVQRLKGQDNLVILPVFKGKNLFNNSKNTYVPISLPEARELHLFDEEMIFLGFDGQVPYFAANIFNEDQVSGLNKNWEFKSLHSIINLITFTQASILAYARGMSIWHSNSVFCGKCGMRTESDEEGHIRKCISLDCSKKIFPRIDPAVITLVEHPSEECCLLGRQANWPFGMYSVIAGFLEIGESLEECVKREVAEETGIIVNRVLYQGSQPWPFPSSLMLGFAAKAETSQFSPKDNELEKIIWVSRKGLKEFTEMEDIDSDKKLPSKHSIARTLIDSWVKKEIKFL